PLRGRPLEGPDRPRAGEGRPMRGDLLRPPGPGARAGSPPGGGPPLRGARRVPPRRVEDPRDPGPRAARRGRPRPPRLETGPPLPVRSPPALGLRPLRGGAIRGEATPGPGDSRLPPRGEARHEEPRGIRPRGGARRDPREPRGDAAGSLRPRRR